LKREEGGGRRKVLHRKVQIHPEFYSSFLTL
jgi:hypothetical protein